MKLIFFTFFLQKMIFLFPVLFFVQARQQRMFDPPLHKPVLIFPPQGVDDTSMQTPLRLPDLHVAGAGVGAGVAAGKSTTIASMSSISDVRQSRSDAILLAANHLLRAACELGPQTPSMLDRPLESFGARNPRSIRAF
jgi:hypothetical protein